MFSASFRRPSRRMRRVVSCLGIALLGLAVARCHDQSPDVTPATVTITPVGSTSILSGATLQLTASVFNAGGDPLNGDVVDWVSADPAIATITPAGVVTGVHTGQTAVTAMLGALQSDPVTVTVSPGAPSQLGIRTQPAGGASGIVLSTQPIVEIRDAAGNVVTSSNASVTAIIATGGGTIVGSTATATNGVATFTGLAITGSVGDRTLSFGAAGLTSVTSAGFSVGPGAATKLVVRTEPTGAASGVSFVTQPQVEVRDDADNLVTTSTADITATIASGGGTLTGATAKAVGGIATFSGLSITGLVGARTLTFSSAGLTSATSSSFTLIAGQPVALKFRRAPAGAMVGAPLSTQPILEIDDAGGNVVSSSVVVTAAIASGGGTLTGATATSVGGVATFTKLGLVGLPGRYVLTFSAPGLTPVTADPLTLGVGNPTQLVILTQPDGAFSGSPLVTQPVLQVEDDAGNIVRNYAGSVSAGVASGSGVASSAVANVVNGVAAYSALTVTGPAGNVTLQFSSGSLRAVSSAPFVLAPSPNLFLVVTVPPPFSVQNGVPITPAMVVEVRDGSGNRVNTNVLITFVTDAVSGTITNASAMAINGVATFTGLTLSGPPGERNYQFTAPGVQASTLIRIGIL